jgi:pyruvate formate lyase activating enzyme
MSTGRIFDIQRFSIHDGPGIRTTVFLKGCPLRCLWCGNPESIPPEPSLSYLADKCIGCGECVKVCRPGAVSLSSAGKAAVNRQLCTRCGDCAGHCDPKALEMVGRTTTAEDVLAIVLRDHAYYEASGGGLTLSGGEPLLQPDFAEALLNAAKVEGLHCCVETSGYGPWDAVDRLRPLVDVWLYDCKETDPHLHAKFTGVWNSQILENLQRLHDAGAKIVLRCPMIPQHNARVEHLEGIVALARKLPKLQGVELLPYYDLWRAKLKRFGLTTAFPASVQPPERATVDSWNDYLRNRGVRVVSEKSR